ncbi:MAG: formate dehydrogenase accessory sulfurtransferase FdhD [bacterium]|nr:formate dehydrogenase accessory sulfurtransferase FdhD [bacterium]
MPDDVPAGATCRELANGRSDLLVREEPLLLVIDGQQLLTMRTPGADEKLARGFLLGEGIVDSLDDVASIEFLPGDQEARRTDELQVTLNRAPGTLASARLARTHELRSSCGVCGIADPGTILDDTPPLLPGVPRIPRATLQQLVTALADRQELFTRTGGSHAALVATGDGAIHGHGEDVGRHNALDKAIGSAAEHGIDLARGIAVLSGRTGYDLVIKCLRVQLPIIVSVSAPSALAFDLCENAGATLIGFARGERLEIYCGAGRVVD